MPPNRPIILITSIVCLVRGISPTCVANELVVSSSRVVSAKLRATIVSKSDRVDPPIELRLDRSLELSVSQHSSVHLPTTS